MGRPWVWQGGPPVPTYTACAESSEATPCSPTAAAPGLLSGLWWKLLSLQPLRLLAYLPVLGCLRPAAQEDPTHFTVNGLVQAATPEQ